jgi:glycosyltransferase 2 family protein
VAESAEPVTSTERSTLAPPRGGWWRRHWGKLAVSILIALGFAWLLHAGALPLVPGRAAFSNVSWGAVLGYVLLWCLVHVLRAVRWYWLLLPVHPVPMKKIVNVSFIGFAAIVALPFRTGEMVRPVLIRKQGQLSGWAATGTIGAERVIDGLFLSALLFFSLLVSEPLDPLPDRIGDLPVPASVVPGAAYGALALFAVAFAMMAMFYWRRHFARRLTESLVGLVSRRLASWLAERVEKVARGLEFLPRARYLVPFLAITALYWLLNAASTWLLGWGVGFTHMTYPQACVNMGVLALGILLPNAPGFFGAFQISVYAALALYFSPDEVVGPGAAFVFLIYLAQMGITFGAALIAMLLEGTGLREALGTRARDLDAS